MTQPGRRGTLTRSAFTLLGNPVRLKCPDDLGEPERAVYADIVGACEPTHFRASDLPLLAAYCRAVVMEQRAAGEFSREPILPDGKPNPWGVIHAAATKSLLGLSLRLRLSPQGRGKPSTKAEPRLSYYERMAILEPEPDPDEAAPS
jgi:phage terminase small subunit